MAIASTRVLVENVDELGNRMKTVAHDTRGRALGDGHDFAADHQYPMIVAGQELLDDDARADRGSLFEGRPDLLVRQQIGG